MSSTASTNEIEAKRLTLAKALRAARSEAEGLSLAVVSGDEQAIKRLAELQVEINRLNNDSQVFDRAHAAAERLEMEEAAREEAQRRQDLYQAAKAVYAEIIEAGAKVDEGLNLIREGLGFIASKEAGFRLDLHGYGPSEVALLNAGTVFQHPNALIQQSLQEHFDLSKPPRNMKVQSSLQHAWDLFERREEIDVRDMKGR